MTWPISWPTFKHFFFKLLFQSNNVLTPGWFWYEGPYFVKEHSDSKNKYTEEDIIKMLEFLVDNIFVVFVGKVSNR